MPPFKFHITCPFTEIADKRAKKNNENTYYNKYKDRDNYYEHKKMIEKELEYEPKNEEDKKDEKKDENESNEITIDFNKKIDRKNFTSGNNKYYNSNKKYGFNRQYNKNNSGFGIER